MKIALTGLGKMGHEVENLIKEKGMHEMTSLKEADVAIDFTAPEAVLGNIKEAAKLGKNIVIGTTGWYEQMEEVKKIVNEAGIGLIYGQNFSVGANIFFKIVDFANSLFNKFGNYEVAGYEIHHSAKKDSPSGTAKKIASLIGKDENSFASVRVGRNPGFHEVIFDSQADEIRLSHSAHSRRGFAEGAILAAEFIKDKKGFYSFDEVFK